MINGSFPIVAQKTMDYCQLRLDWSLLILITYLLTPSYSNINPITVVSCFYDRNFRRNFDAVCFSDQNSDGKIISALYFSFFLVGKADISILQEFRLWKSSVIYPTSFILRNKFCWVCANIKYSRKLYVIEIFSWHWKLLI